MEEPQEKSITESVETKIEQDGEADNRKMYPAVCSSCGKECEVPFEPVEGKPVKCKECYKKKQFKKFGNRNFQKEMHDAVCSKCNKKCQVPFKPNGKKPILCKECYIESKNSN